MMRLGLVMTAVLLASAAQARPQATAPASPPVDEAAFLARNARAPGVTALPGLQYEVLRSGPADGPHPARADEITVRYEGRFLDGRVFNTSPDNGAGVTTFPLQKLIPGWQAALPLMRPGDVWRLWLPANLAYGHVGKSYIPPDSPLVFRIELVSVTKAAPPAPTG
jgi:FKBP-type peptidyl-prolyl cis-trans isomerase